jgi:hypothetical protein
MDEKDAWWRAQSLMNLIKTLELQIEIQEYECCRNWYAQGRAWFAELLPDAPALQLAMAGAMTVDNCARRGGAGYMTEADAPIVLAATAAERETAIQAVNAIFAADVRRMDIERVAALRLEIAAA